MEGCEHIPGRCACEHHETCECDQCEAEAAAAALPAAAAVALPDPAALPLARKWVVWISRPPAKGQPRTNENCGSFATVADMWGALNFVRVDAISLGADLCYFAEGVKPTWEDNAKGGRWMVGVTITNTAGVLIPANVTAARATWETICLGLFGGSFADGGEAVGVVASRRGSIYRLSVWTRDCHSPTVLQLGERIKACFLEQRLGGRLEYAKHGADYGDTIHKITV